MADIRVEERREIVNWGAAIIAGLLGGVFYLLWAMLLAPTLGDAPSPWAPPRMIAAIAMGEEVLPPPATFDAGIVATAMAVHFVLSIIYGIVLGLVAHRLELGAALAVGAVAGLVIYLVNFHGFTAVFPWFADARNWITIVGHILFGVVVAWAYKAIAGRERVPAAV